MKTGFVALLVTAAAVASAFAAQDTPAGKAIVTSYLQIQKALAEDRTDGVKGAAEAIAQQASALGKPGEALATAAKALERAKDLKAAREAFGPLSDAVIAAASAGNWREALAGTHVGYCSMANRSWLQSGDKIRNPYYGSSMLTCGEIKK